eukprot:snap_masked-scaffold_1-processed-gene-16.48-mRNA-1 protein AED:0.73 eAED:0.73 QI:0/0/0/0.5/1/1/2/0/140
MYIVYLIHSGRLSTTRDAAWDEVGTLVANDLRFHESFQRSDAYKEEDNSSEEDSDTDQGKDGETEIQDNIAKENKTEEMNTLFHPIVFDEVSEKNIIQGSRKRNAVHRKILGKFSIAKIYFLKKTNQQNQDKKFEIMTVA